MGAVERWSGGNVQTMNNNIKALIQLMDEHPDLPVIPVVGQGVVSDCIGEWAASF